LSGDRGRVSLFQLNPMRSMRMPKHTDPETKAIMRAALFTTVVEFALVGFLLLGLAEAASSLATRLSARFMLSAYGLLTLALFVAFAAALAFVVWSFSRRNRAWSDHMKDIVPLGDFLQHDSAKRILAPNLDEHERAAVVANLQAIAAREDVMRVTVGLLPDEGYLSDRIVIKTFAPDDVIRHWPELLDTGFRTISTLRYEVNGKRRKVRSLLFVWD